MSIEKRRHPRLQIAIEVRVRGRDKRGQRFEEPTLSGDISSSGCALFLSRDLAIGSELELEFVREVPGKQEPLALPFRCTVVRATAVNAVQYTIGVEFMNGVFPIDALDQWPSL